MRAGLRVDDRRDGRSSASVTSLDEPVPLPPSPPTAREGRLVREIAGRLGADLALVNDGEPRHGVDALLRWRQRLRDAA